MADTFTNYVTTTVAASHGASTAGTVETWVVGSSAGFPNLASGGQFHINDQADTQIPPEAILVTAGPTGSNSWTVTRGDEGTSPTAHSAGFTIVGPVITAGGLNSFKTVFPPSTSSPFYSCLDYGVSSGTPTVDQSAAVNTFLTTIPSGCTAFFPATGGPTATTQYYVKFAVEVPRTIRVAGPAWGIGTPTFTAMAGFADSQVVRNWQQADVTAHPNASNPVTGNLTQQFYPPNTTGWNTSGAGNNYFCMENIGIDVNGQSNVTCLGMVHLNERTYIKNLTFKNTAGAGTGNRALAIFATTESLGDGRFEISNLTGYGTGWKNWFYIDGTAGETNISGNENQRDVDILGFTSPANANNQGTGAVCSDSTIYVRDINRIRLEGHIECPAPNGANDTACIRLVNVSNAAIKNFWYAPGTGAYRPFVRATQDAASGAGPTIQGSQGGFLLHNVELTSSPFGGSPRNDSCTITAGSASVTDAAIVAGDVGRPVYGPGIPSGAFVASVGSGTFTLGNNFGSGPGFTQALFSGSVTLAITVNVIEDESAIGGSAPGSGIYRHWQYHATLFAPVQILHYCGTEMSWMNYPAAATCQVMYARSAFADAYTSALAPAGIAESYPASHGAGFSSHSILVTGDLNLAALPLYPGDKITSLSWWTGGTGVTTPTHQWGALFDENQGQVAISGDGTSGAWAAYTQKTFTMSSPWVASLPAVHWAGLLVAAGAPMPSILGANEEAAASGGAASPATAMAMGGTSSTGLTSPSSCPAVAAAITTVAGRAYVLGT